MKNLNNTAKTMILLSSPPPLPPLSKTYMLTFNFLLVKVKTGSKVKNFRRYVHVRQAQTFRKMTPEPQTRIESAIFPYENFRCNFTCRKTYEIRTFKRMKFSFHLWNWDVFTYEIPNSHVKSTVSKFHMWNHGVRYIYIAYELEHAHMKIYFTYKIFISDMKLKQFTYEILFSYVKWHVKFCKGSNDRWEGCRFSLTTVHIFSVVSPNSHMHFEINLDLIHIEPLILCTF